MKPCTIFAFLAGALMGATAAILLAPDSGKNTRKKIKDMAQKEYDSVKQSFNKEHCDCNSQECDCNAPDCNCD